MGEKNPSTLYPTPQIIIPQAIQGAKAPAAVNPALTPATAAALPPPPGPASAAAPAAGVSAARGTCAPECGDKERTTGEKDGKREGVIGERVKETETVTEKGKGKGKDRV